MVGTNLQTMLNNNSFAVILSAELDLPHYDLPLRNEMATVALTISLQATGLRFMPVVGVYKGVKEASFIVFCNNVFDVLRLECLALDQHSQESILVLDLEHACAVLKYKEQALMIGANLVQVTDVTGLDAYTCIDGEYWAVI